MHVQKLWFTDTLRHIINVETVSVTHILLLLVLFQKAITYFSPLYIFCRYTENLMINYNFSINFNNNQWIIIKKNNLTNECLLNVSGEVSSESTTKANTGGRESADLASQTSNNNELSSRGNLAAKTAALDARGASPQGATHHLSAAATPKPPRGRRRQQNHNGLDAPQVVVHLLFHLHTLQILTYCRYS